MPAELYARDIGGLCSNVGGDCKGHGEESCSEIVGVAVCKDGFVDFTSCDICIQTGNSASYF